MGLAAISASREVEPALLVARPHRPPHSETSCGAHSPSRTDEPLHDFEEAGDRLDHPPSAKLVVAHREHRQPRSAYEPEEPHPQTADRHHSHRPLHRTHPRATARLVIAVETLQLPIEHDEPRPMPPPDAMTHHKHRHDPTRQLHSTPPARSTASRSFQHGSTQSERAP